MPKYDRTKLYLPIINKSDMLPKNKRLPCLFCGKPLPPEYRLITPLSQDSSTWHRKFIGYGIDANGYFCTMKCSFRWVIAYLHSVKPR